MYLYHYYVKNKFKTYKVPKGMNKITIVTKNNCILETGMLNREG